MNSCEELIRSYTSKEDCLYDLTARPAPLDLYEIRFSSHCQVSHSSPFPTRQAGNQDGGFEQGEEEDGLCTSPFEKCMLWIRLPSRRPTEAFQDCPPAKGYPHSVD